MTPKQINAANLIYNKNFADEIDPVTLMLMESIESLDDLDQQAPVISAGEYDCIEAILENR